MRQLTGTKTRQLFTFAFLAFTSIAHAIEPPLTLPTDSERAAAFVPPSMFTGLSTVAPADSFIVVSDTKHEVARITYSGRVYLNGKEVHTDRQYRAAMMAIIKAVKGCTP